MRGGQREKRWSVAGGAALLCVCLAATGCCAPPLCVDGQDEIPRELDKVSLSTYVLEPPDIILLDAVRLVPKPPYHIESLDELFINVTNPLTEPIGGIYAVDPDGTVNLGASYGAVKVIGLTIEQARKAVEDQLKKVIKEPVVQVSLARARALQQVRGEHLVRPDGTIGLGTFGSVPVVGLTLDEAKAAIEAHMSQFAQKPEFSLDVFAYNSKVYYIITDGGGAGEQVFRFSITGNETVLDAVSQINGLPVVASRKRIWLARPAPAQEHEQILPIDWRAITRCAKTETNYQVLPGDRIYVQAEPIITFDTTLAKIFLPIERVFGITLLGNATVRSFRGNRGSGNTGGTGGLFGF